MEFPQENNLPTESRPFSGPQLDPQTLLLLKQNVLKPVSAVLPGASAATAANYGQFFVADRAYYFITISERHNVAGSDAGAVTVTLEKCASGVAPGAGAVLLASALSLKATARVPQYGTPTLTAADRLIKRGDTLVLKLAGTPTDVSDVCVTVLLQEA